LTGNQVPIIMRENSLTRSFRKIGTSSLSALLAKMQIPQSLHSFGMTSVGCYKGKRWAARRPPLFTNQKSVEF